MNFIKHSTRPTAVFGSELRRETQPFQPLAKQIRIGNGRIFRRPFGAHAACHRDEERLAVRIAEEGRRIAAALRAVYDAVRVRDVRVVRPAHQPSVSTLAEANYRT